MLVLFLCADKRKGTLRDWVREKRKEDPEFRMNATKSAPGSSQGNEDGDIFPGE
jgi:hypothetical protein